LTRDGAVFVKRISQSAGRMAAIALVALLLGGCIGSGGKLVGTNLDKTPAPDFTLTDQNNASVSLSQFRGQAVVLTFIYTHCPDVCPATAELLRVSWQALSAKDRQQVALLAVTVDPTRDTDQALQNFSHVHGLDQVPTWHALRGDQSTLQSVWSAYGIDAIAIQNHEDGVSAAPPNPIHTDAIYVIDPKGQERVLLSSTTSAKDLIHNLQTLAG
jgi:protein SCO1/2